jgi:biopolymer transport protein ExbB/TolQ
MEILLLLANEAPSFTLTGMWDQMGIFAKLVLIVLILQFVITSVMSIERFLVYTKAKRQSISYIMMLRNFLNERKLEEAVAAVKQHGGSPIAKVVGAGMDEYLQGLEALQEEGPEDVGDFDLVDAVNRALERVKERETTNLRRGLGGLATVASAAPFVGLLGTVIGIINAFSKLAGGGGMDVVGPGIAEALVNTAVGLFVAIPAAMFFNFFTGMVERFVVDMNDVSSEFVGYVLKEGRAK